MKKKNSAKQIAKIYNYLISSNIVGNAEAIKEGGVRQFTNIFKQTPTKIKNILIEAYKHNATHLTNIVTIPTLHDHLPRIPSSKAFRIEIGTNKAKNPKTIYNIKMMKFDHKSGYRDPNLSLVPKYKNLPKGMKFTTTATPGWEGQISEFFEKSTAETPLDILMELLDMIDKFIEFMRQKKAHIDASSDHWDKMTLWYATYVSEKGPEGFVGYEVTWSLLGNMIAEMGKQIIERAGMPNAFAKILAMATNREDPQGEAVENLNRFIQAIEKWVTIDYPKGTRVECNLGHMKRMMADVKKQATGDAMLKGIGHTELEKDILAAALGEENPLEEIMAIGMGYLDLYNETYDATFALRSTITKRNKKRYKPVSKDVEGAWETRVGMRWTVTNAGV